VVEYVRFHPQAFLSEIKPVTEEDALLRYEQSPESYVREVAAPDAEGAETSATQTEQIPFEEAKAGIISTIQNERAKKKAQNAATDFAIQLMPSRRTAAKEINAFAAELNLTVQSVGPFSFGDMVPGVQNPFTFAREVFKLGTDELERVSNPIEMGGDIVVLFLKEIVPARIPEMEEVTDQVTNRVTVQKTQEAVEALAEELTTQVQDAVASGTSFADAVTALSLTPEVPFSFQNKDFNQRMPTFPPVLARDIGTRQVGDVYGPVTGRAGDVMIGYVTARIPKPADTAEILTTVKDQIASRVQFPAFAQRFDEQVIEPRIVKKAVILPAEEEEAETE
jgi:hypothetical protein